MDNELLEKFERLLANEMEIKRLIKAENAVLTRQRDELLAALEDIRGLIPSDVQIPFIQSCRMRADSAIAATGQGE